MCGTALHAIGHIHPLALVAFENLPGMPERLGGAERTDHDAHPASDAPLIPEQDQTSFIPVERTGRAGIQTGCVFAVPALDGEALFCSGGLDSKPWHRSNGFIDRVGELSGQGRAVHGAGDFAGPAGRAAVRVDEDGFHKKSASNASSPIKCLKF
jgi:hypothetical protein